MAAIETFAEVSYQSSRFKVIVAAAILLKPGASKPAGGEPVLGRLHNPLLFGADLVE
jgi:hypothetical protein